MGQKYGYFPDFFFWLMAFVCPSSWCRRYCGRHHWYPPWSICIGTFWSAITDLPAWQQCPCIFVGCKYTGISRTRGIASRSKQASKQWAETRQQWVEDRGQEQKKKERFELWIKTARRFAQLLQEAQKQQTRRKLELIELIPHRSLFERKIFSKKNIYDPDVGNSWQGSTTAVRRQPQFSRH